ncbi:hypothetical protein HZB89_00460 [archaeon]|nr:hypothetical protein [archaeon]
MKGASRNVFALIVPAGKERIKLVAKQKRTEAKLTNLLTREEFTAQVKRGYLEELKITEAFIERTSLNAEKPVGMFIEKDETTGKFKAFTLFGYEKGFTIDPYKARSLQQKTKNFINKQLAKDLALMHSNFIILTDYKPETIRVDTEKKVLTYTDLENITVVQKEITKHAGLLIQHLDISSAELAKVIWMHSAAGLMKPEELDGFIADYSSKIIPLLDKVKLAHARQRDKYLIALPAQQKTTDREAFEAIKMMTLRHLARFAGQVGK